jgi:ribosomal-protein-serine acetyltransferase
MDPQLKVSIDVGDDLLMRQFRHSDEETVYRRATANYQHLREYMHWMTPDYSLRSAREFIARSLKAVADRTSLTYGLFRGDAFLGSIGFVNFDWPARKTEIGYWISAEEQGKGIVTQSVRTLIAYAFGDLELNRVEIRCAASNTRSRAVAERLGFVMEGVLRQSEIRHGVLHDFVIYGMLREEWSNGTTEI